MGVDGWQIARAGLLRVDPLCHKEAFPSWLTEQPLTWMNQLILNEFVAITPMKNLGASQPTNHLGSYIWENQQHVSQPPTRHSRTSVEFSTNVSHSPAQELGKAMTRAPNCHTHRISTCWNRLKSPFHLQPGYESEALDSGESKLNLQSHEAPPVEPLIRWLWLIE